MLKNYLFYSILSLLLPCLAAAQITIQIRDAETKQPLPFSTISCSERNWGSYANAEGILSLTDSSIINCRTIFSHVGYASDTTYIADKSVIYLRKLPNKLKDVSVKNCNLKKKQSVQIRNRKSNYSFGFGGSSNGFIWAAFVANPIQKAGLIQTVSFGVVAVYKEAKSATPIRVRFFERDTETGFPGEEITNEVIDLVPGKFGWVTFDISQYKVFMPDNGVYVAFEMFDAGKQYHYNVVHNMSDGTKQEREHYGWSIEGLRGDALGYRRSAAGKWYPQFTMDKKDAVSPAAGLTFEHCFD